MGKSRLLLQSLLETLQETEGEPLGEPRVHFQPSENIRLTYPCIVYSRDYSQVAHADNAPYQIQKRYLVTVITRDPDSKLPDQVEWLPQASFQRFFTRDQLNHYIFNLFF